MVFVKIYDFMFCELKYAKKYTECAIMYKTNNDVEMYNTCIKLAEAELSHAEIWHNMSDTKIKIFTEKILKDFSKRVNILPGILVGRLQKDCLIKWNEFNYLKN